MIIVFARSLTLCLSSPVPLFRSLLCQWQISKLKYYFVEIDSHADYLVFFPFIISHCNCKLNPLSVSISLCINFVLYLSLLFLFICFQVYLHPSLLALL